MPGEPAFYCRQSVGDIIHDIEARAAVNVQINVARRDQVAAQFDHRNSGGKNPSLAAGNLDDFPLVNQQQPALDSVRRSHQQLGSKNQHINVLIKGNRRFDENCISLFRFAPQLRQTC